MSLIKQKYNYEEIKRVSTEGKRLYACPDGNSVASVTLYLTKPKTKLLYWLGRQELVNKKQKK